jgi:hypothetical protein
VGVDLIHLLSGAQGLEDLGGHLLANEDHAWNRNTLAQEPPLIGQPTHTAHDVRLAGVQRLSGGGVMAMLV